MVNLLLCEDTEALTQRGTIRTIYDPACRTGGTLLPWHSRGLH
jgi:type I restriction enzyme M protein